MWKNNMEEYNCVQVQVYRQLTETEDLKLSRSSITWMRAMHKNREKYHEDEMNKE